IVRRDTGAGAGGRPRVVLSRTVRTTGVSESALAERIGPIEAEIDPLTLAYLPSTDGVDLRLTAWRLEQGDAETRLATAATRLRALVGEHGYGEDGTDLAAVVLAALRAGRQRLGVAESCTGGLVAKRITDVAGASDTFIGGVVAYADVIKTAALKVPLETLQAHGAVAEETVRAMAEGAQRLVSAAASIAGTGIATRGAGARWASGCGTRGWQRTCSTSAATGARAGAAATCRGSASCSAISRRSGGPSGSALIGRSCCWGFRSGGSWHCATWRRNRATRSRPPSSAAPGSASRFVRPPGSGSRVECSLTCGRRSPYRWAWIPSISVAMRR